MKKLIYSAFALAALTLASACDKQNTEPAEEPRLYVNTWAVNFNETDDATKDEWTVFTLNADGTATIGEVFSQKSLDNFKEEIDTEKLTEEQKALVDGLKEYDVVRVEGWYSIKANADGSNVLCFVFDSMYNGEVERHSISFHVKDITKDHMLVFGGFDAKDEPYFCDAYSLETSPMKPGTFYEQKTVSEIPSKEPEYS